MVLLRKAVFRATGLKGKNMVVCHGQELIVEGRVVRLLLLPGNDLVYRVWHTGSHEGGVVIWGPPSTEDMCTIFEITGATGFGPSFLFSFLLCPILERESVFRIRGRWRKHSKDACQNYCYGYRS